MSHSLATLAQVRGRADEDACASACNDSRATYAQHPRAAHVSRRMSQEVAAVGARRDVSEERSPPPTRGQSSPSTGVRPPVERRSESPKFRALRRLFLCERKGAPEFHSRANDYRKDQPVTRQVSICTPKQNVERSRKSYVKITQLKKKKLFYCINYLGKTLIKLHSSARKRHSKLFFSSILNSRYARGYTQGLRKLVMRE